MAALKSTPATRRAKAFSGAYGAKPFHRADEYADTLLRAIQQELHDVDSFSRDDLLHLPAFDYVATITRYGIVREAVSRLLETGRLAELSRTELCLPGDAKRARTTADMQPEYAATVNRLATTLARRGDTFSVATVVNAWKSDQHVSQGAKRTMARNLLAAMVRAGELERVGPGQFEPVED